VSERVPTIFLVDDDRAVLRALTRLLQSSGYSVCAFESPLEFLREYDDQSPGCVVLDVAMPGLDGLELQQRLLDSPIGSAIVFISGAADIPKTVRAMKRGAVDFLVKPFDEAELLGAVEAAIQRSLSARKERLQAGELRERLASLTRREREVLEQLVAGKRNKEIATVLGTTEKTIKVHRARVMHKMQASSFASLVRMSERAGIVS
jgi:FixJ family two-component response regulator